MTLDELIHWAESDDLYGNSPVIANVDGLQLPLEKIEVRNGKLVIFVDMYNGLYEEQKEPKKR